LPNVFPNEAAPFTASALRCVAAGLKPFSEVERILEILELMEVESISTAREANEVVLVV